MKLEVPVFDVLMDRTDVASDPGDLTHHRVQVRGSDHLRAELEGKRQGVGIKDAMHTTYLWAWSAMLREGKLPAGTAFHDFMACVVLVEQEKDDDDQPVVEALDPTQPAAATA